MCIYMRRDLSVRGPVRKQAAVQVADHTIESSICSIDHFTNDE